MTAVPLRQNIKRSLFADIEFFRRTPGFKCGFEAGMAVTLTGISIIASLTLLVIAALS